MKGFTKIDGLLNFQDYTSKSVQVVESTQKKQDEYSKIVVDPWGIYYDRSNSVDFDKSYLDKIVKLFNSHGSRKPGRFIADYFAYAKDRYQSIKLKISSEMDITTLTLNQREDEWFLVEFVKTSLVWPTQTDYYKCDQISGLLKLLSDLGFISTRWRQVKKN